MPSYATTVEVPVTVEYVYHAPTKGHRDKFGVPEEPDEGPTVEITAVFAGKQNIINSLAGTSQIEELEDLILNDENN